MRFKEKHPSTMKFKSFHHKFVSKIFFSLYNTIEILQTKIPFSRLEWLSSKLYKFCVTLEINFFLDKFISPLQLRNLQCYHLIHSFFSTEKRGISKYNKFLIFNICTWLKILCCIYYYFLAFLFISFILFFSNFTYVFMFDNNNVLYFIISGYAS